MVGLKFHYKSSRHQFLLKLDLFVMINVVIKLLPYLIDFLHPKSFVLKFIEANFTF